MLRCEEGSCECLQRGQDAGCAFFLKVIGGHRVPLRVQAVGERRRSGGAVIGVERADVAQGWDSGKAAAVGSGQRSRRAVAVHRKVRVSAGVAVGIVVLVAIVVWNRDVVDAEIVWIEVCEHCRGTVRDEVGLDGLGAGWRHCVATVTVATVVVVAVAVAVVALNAAVAVAVVALNAAVAVAVVALNAAVAIAIAAVVVAVIAVVAVKQRTVHGAVRLPTLREVIIDGTCEGRVVDRITISSRVWPKAKLIIASCTRAFVQADEHRLGHVFSIHVIS